MKARWFYKTPDDPYAIPHYFLAHYYSLPPSNLPSTPQPTGKHQVGYIVTRSSRTGTDKHRPLQQNLTIALLSILEADSS